MVLPSPNSPEYIETASFEEKLSRSLVLDDLHPLVTVSIITTALSQYGNVQSVKIIPSPLDSKSAPVRALVEMANPREAALAIEEIQERPFMIKYVPRPVTAMPAKATLFPERPPKLRKMDALPVTAMPAEATLFPERPPKLRKMDACSDRSNDSSKHSCVWVLPGDPEWNIVNQQKRLAKKHALEALYLTQELRKEEEKLARDQDEKATLYMKKLNLVESCMRDKTWALLSRRYGLRAQEK